MSAPSSQQTNQLIHEKSPYLLQHAHNPVHWYPWGQEAFEKARLENKPIFLSIGYSTCHWCHVMEQESFSNPETAKIMNEHFISIKVDREERPDIDQIYMNAVMQMTGAGGWPLSVFLTPGGKPFYGGTYFPPEALWGHPSFREILLTIAKTWNENQESALQSAEQLTQALTQTEQNAENQKTKLNDSILTAAYQSFVASFDHEQGGFGDKPKFPRAHTLSFLLRYFDRTQEKMALEMVKKTLYQIHSGGIYDHLGGGFHRYSTDSMWLVPHFEKMLYDQALNTKAYLEAYQITQDPSFARVIHETLDYVLREMTSPEGGFYSAQDADSALSPDHPHTKVEGAFFVFERSEIESLLGKTNADLFCFAYGITKQGNAGAGAHDELQKKNVLFQAHTVEETAKKFNLSPEEAEKIITQAKNRLFAYREKRPHPSWDDKILTDWNGLMLSTLAIAGPVLNEPRYTEAAQRSADFILTKLRTKEERLLHRYRDQEADIPGYLDDYAFFVQGLIDLYEATFETKYLAAAKELTQKMIRYFWDEKEGGFYMTAHDAEKLIARTKESYDGALPSGNSIAILDLIRMSRFTMDPELAKKAEQAFLAFSNKIQAFPQGYPQMLIALDFALGPSKEIMIAGDEKNTATQEMLQEVWSRFIPNKVLIFRPEKVKKAQKLIEIIPFIEEQTALEGKTTAYVCENYVCALPVTEISELIKLLK